MYFGLQTGWISMMSLQSSLLGFAMFKPFQHMLKHKFGPIENVVLQTTAVATATMPLAAGNLSCLMIQLLRNSSKFIIRFCWCHSCFRINDKK
jgi:uncharacterized oligopeptide transporter (OPT) family protein